MRDLEELEARLVALADEGEPRGARVVMDASRRVLAEEPAAGSRRRRSAVPVLAALAVVALVVVVVLLVARRDGPDPGLVPVDPSRDVLRDLFDTSDLPAPERPLFLVPGHVPEGMEPFRVTGGFRPGETTGSYGSPEVDGSQTWMRFDESGTRPVDEFMVSWGRGTGDPLGRAGPGATPVEVRGRAGAYASRRSSLVWEEPAHRWIEVTGPPLSLEQLQAIAAGIRARSDGGIAVTQSPDGYVQVSERLGMASGGANLRDVVYRDQLGRAFRVIVVDDSGAPPGVNLSGALTGVSHPRLVPVRGRHAVLTDTLFNGGWSYDQQTWFLMASDTFVQWLEPGDVMVTVSGLGLSEDELLAVARGLRITDAAGWEQLLVQAPGRAGASPVPESERGPFTGEQAEIADAFRGWLDASDDDPAAAVESVEGGAGLRDTLVAARGAAPAGDLSGRVDSVRLVGPDRALVTFTILNDGRPFLADQQGSAVRQRGRWLVSRATFCAIVGIGATHCPPR